ncbi:hypothetical protein EFW58_03335 [Bacillus velezensis]|nr:hypothetical protein EFW58_03335 [Bacillus velezensis]
MKGNQALLIWLISKLNHMRMIKRAGMKMNESTVKQYLETFF